MWGQRTERPADAGSARGLLTAAFAVALVLAAVSPAAAATHSPTDPETPAPPSAPSTAVLARQDSLRQAIRERLLRIETLRDSLGSVDDPDLQKAMKGLEEVIADLEDQLRDIDVRVQDRAIMFSSPRGNIQIDIPEGWEDKVSQGLSAITSTILSELPDTLDLQGELRKLQHQSKQWNWDVFGTGKHERKIIGNEIFTTGNDVVVDVDERVTGNVVVLFGDATILGEVNGDVVDIGGTLTLAEDAVVDGTAVAILGSLRRDDSAQVGNTVVVIGGSWDSSQSEISGLAKSSTTRALVIIVPLLVIAGLVLLVFALLPEWRLDAVAADLRARPARAFVGGLVWTVFGQVLLLLVVAVLTVTVIGIPVALLLALAYLLFGMAAMGVAAGQLGRRLCRTLCPDRLHSLATVALGLLLFVLPLLLGILLTTSVPLLGVGRLLVFIGVAVNLLFYCLGSGAIFASRFGGRRRPQTEPAV